MKWISVKERLPKSKQMENYDWVLVSDADGRWTIARYGQYFNYETLDLTYQWEFWEMDDVALCPFQKNQVSRMRIEDITHWLEVWDDLPKVTR